MNKEKKSVLSILLSLQKYFKVCMAQKNFCQHMTYQVHISLKSPDSISYFGRMCGLAIKETDYKTRAWFVLNFACSSKQILQFLCSSLFPSVKWEWQHSFISQEWVLIIVCRTTAEMDVNSFFYCSQCRFCKAQSIAKGLKCHPWSCNTRKNFPVSWKSSLHCSWMSQPLCYHINSIY